MIKYDLPNLQESHIAKMDVGLKLCVRRRWQVRQLGLSKCEHLFLILFRLCLPKSPSAVI